MTIFFVRYFNQVVATKSWV